jgi:hypothetical protein
VKVDLAVIGQGAVSPAGIGLEALLHRQPVPVSLPALGQPDPSWPVLRVDLKDSAFVRWQRESRLRRASSITYFLTETAEQALSGVSPADRAETGLIVTFSTGCLAYSRRFFEGIVKQGQKTASPALFPETVFNSPVSHVASVLGLNGAAYALIGDEAAWVAAIKTASIWLQRQRVKQVLILGAEEFDPIVLDAYRSARWLRRQNSTCGFLTSEGSGGILVRGANASDAKVISVARDGLIYRSRREAVDAAQRLFHAVDPALPCYRTARHNWLGSLEEQATAGRPSVSPATPPYLGEAFTASAAWHTLRALNQPHSNIFLPVWGLNHQLSSLELETRK